ncbi:hypothetical protein FISHEDRAFT_76625 [Fistulina hepatica ATCC 64428]|uniref:Uncharacterized protein n=1 Tax=Fistulina hepatica ATCC 64428 TaxID=1128425 RepID=A0A0D7A4Z2_9AGAR|nr:hypothetical protein FISHEDRAFT_76625 [Fistulina hepatica ATCC 64428]
MYSDMRTIRAIRPHNTRSGASIVLSGPLTHAMNATPCVSSFSMLTVFASYAGAPAMVQQISPKPYASGVTTSVPSDGVQYSTVKFVEQGFDAQGRCSTAVKRRIMDDSLPRKRRRNNSPAAQAPLQMPIAAAMANAVSMPSPQVIATPVQPLLAEIRRPCGQQTQNVPTLSPPLTPLVPAPTPSRPLVKPAIVKAHNVNGDEGVEALRDFATELAAHGLTGPATMVPLAGVDSDTVDALQDVHNAPGAVGANAQARISAADNITTSSDASSTAIDVAVVSEDSSTVAVGEIITTNATPNLKKAVSSGADTPSSTTSSKVHSCSSSTLSRVPLRPFVPRAAPEVIWGSQFSDAFAVSPLPPYPFWGKVPVAKTKRRVDDVPTTKHLSDTGKASAARTTGEMDIAGDKTVPESFPCKTTATTFTEIPQNIREVTPPLVSQKVLPARDMHPEQGCKNARFASGPYGDQDQNSTDIEWEKYINFDAF